MDKVENNRFLNGSGGYLWVGGERLAEVKKVEVKITGQFEDVNVAGEFPTFWQYTGYSIEGTITLQKVNSSLASKLAKAYVSGDMPNLDIVTKLEDRVTKAAERAKISGVAMTEFLLASYEAKALSEEAFPFKATYYDILEAKV